MGQILRRVPDEPEAAEEPNEKPEEDGGGTGGAPRPEDDRGETFCSLSRKLMLSLSSRFPRPPPLPRPLPLLPLFAITSRTRKIEANDTNITNIVGKHKERGRIGVSYAGR